MKEPMSSFANHITVGLRGGRRERGVGNVMQNKTPALAEVLSLLARFFLFSHLPLLLRIGAVFAVSAIPNFAAASALVAFTHEMPPNGNGSE